MVNYKHDQLKLKFLLLLLFFLTSSNSFAIRGNLYVLDDMNDTMKKTVKLYVKEKMKPKRFFCSGTKIDIDTVLTAAHCFDSFDESKMSIVIESNKKSFLANKVLINKKYERVDIYDPDWGYLYEIRITGDFALLKTESIFKEKDLVTLMKTNEDSLDIKSVIFSGYGDRANIFGIGEGSGVYRVSDIVKITDQSFDRLLASDGSSGICLGDSGGPIWSKVTNENNTITNYQLGVISQGDCNVYSYGERISLKKINEASFNVINIQE